MSRGWFFSLLNSRFGCVAVFLIRCAEEETCLFTLSQPLHPLLLLSVQPVVMTSLHRVFNSRCSGYWENEVTKTDDVEEEEEGKTGIG